MPKKRSVKAVKVVRISDDADLFKMTSGLGSDYSSVLLFTDTRAVHCPDGTPRFVYRNLDRAFPLFAHDWNATIGGVVNGLRNLQAKVGVDAKKNVVQLYQGLGKLNAALEQN